MKIANLIKLMAVAATSTLLFACGGGGGGVSQGTVVNGVAQAGMFSAGQAVFKGYSGVNKDKEYTLKTVTFVAADKGNFSADIGSYAGLLKVDVSGTYIDEATKKTVTVLASAPLKAAIPAASVINNMTVIVTPLTDIAVNKATEGGAKLTDTSVTASNKAVSTLFGIEDIVNTVPIASDATALTDSTDNKRKAYTAALVTLSQYVAEHAKTATNSVSIADVTSANLQSALSAALIQISSGIHVDNTTTTPVVTITAPAVAFNLNQAVQNAATNTATMALVGAAGTAANTAMTTAITDTILKSDASVKIGVKFDRSFKLKISGAYSGIIAGIQVGINIPAGVTFKTDTSGITLTGVVTATEAGSSVLTEGKVSTDGKVLDVDVVNVNGLSGTFATIYCNAPATVSAADFTLVGSKFVASITGAVIPGLTVTIE